MTAVFFYDIIQIRRKILAPRWLTAAASTRPTGLHTHVVPPLLSVLQYYEMSYGLNIEMHKQVCRRIRTICVQPQHACFLPPKSTWSVNTPTGKHTHTHTYLTLASTLILDRHTHAVVKMLTG